MSEPIINFLNKYNILWEPISFSNQLHDSGKPKKVLQYIGGYMPDPSDYKKLQPEVIKQRQSTQSEFIGIFTNNIQQYDIDSKYYVAPEELSKLPYFESVNKKLPHFFLKVKKYKGERKEVQCGDLLHGMWGFCRRNEIVHNCNNELKEFNSDYFKKRVPEFEFLEIINKLKINIDSFSYEKWLNICFGIYNTVVENIYDKTPVFYVTEFCKDGLKYNEEAIKTINNLSYKSNGKKYKTLVQYSNEKLEVLENSYDSYSEWKKEWEVYVFSCKQRGLVCHDKYKDSHITEAPYGSYYFMNDNEFVELSTRTFSENGKNQKCINKWNIDPTKREYMDYIFAPPPFVKSNKYEYYNTWDGFSLEKYESLVSLDEEHCIKVYNDFKMHLSKGNSLMRDYLIQIDAHVRQRPGEKIGVALIINGPSGTGKGTDSCLQTSLFGEEYVLQTCDISQVLGQFTASMSRKLIVILDEAVPKNMFDKDGPLKSLITEPMIKIERKGKDPYMENSFVHIKGTTNSDFLVNISNSDRRFIVTSPEIYTTPRYDLFPHTIFDLINSKDACKIVFNYLNNIELKYKNMQEWQCNRPITKEYEEMREASIPTHIKFLIDYINNNHLDKLVFNIKQIELHEYYKSFISSNAKYELTFTKFCTQINKILKNERKCVKGVSHREYIINRLEFNTEMNKLNYKITE